MRIVKSIALSILFVSVLFSCSPLKQIEGNRSAALASYSVQNYSDAYSKYSTLIESYRKANINIPVEVLMNAADCASQLQNYSVASDFYSEVLQGNSNTEAIKGLILNTKKAGNQNKVEEFLLKYADDLKAANENSFVAKNQFEIAVSKGDNQAIIETFPNLNEANEEQSLVYLKALENEGKTTEAVDFCNAMLKENPSYDKAKEWKAIYYYNKADDRYKKEMDKYNKNKTYTAYVYLKRDLKKVTADFKVAKDLLEDLHKKYPEEKKYIKYLKNTYIRLEMKEEAAQMDQLLK